jgi:hypothetical protein
VHGTKLKYPKDMLSKALQMGVCFHRVPLMGNMEGCSFLRAFEKRKKILIFIFKRVLRDMQKCPVNGYLSPQGTLRGFVCRDF